MTTRSGSGIYTVRPRIIEGTHQLIFAAQDVIDVVPSQPLHVLIYSFSEKAMCLLEHMAVVYVTESPMSLMTASSAHHSQIPIGTPV